MGPAELDALFDRPFVFRERPTPASADLRAVWRLPVVLLLVGACRSQRATPKQLHVLNWALRSSEGHGALKGFIEGSVRPDQAVVRFEPALDRAVALARGFGLLDWHGRYWSLTERGRGTLKLLGEEEGTLRAEKEALASLPGPLSQAAVERLLGRGRR
jgi:hypothetical protein